MQDTLDKIPPEAWPIVDLLFNLTCAAAAVWLAITVFILWRRHASNLTPVHAAEKNKKADPDFLKVDKAARAEAIARGESFDKELERREREDARAKAIAAGTAKASLGQRIIGWTSFILAIFSLVSGAASVIWTVQRIDGMTNQHGSWQALVDLFNARPLAFTIAATVIVLKIAHFAFVHRKTKEG